MAKEKNFVSAVVYAHNCRDAIGQAVQGLILILQNEFEHYELILIDDGSEDGTADEVREICARMPGDPNLTILTLTRYHGLEDAMRAGVDLSIGDFVFEFDMLPSAPDASPVMELYRKSLDGFDIVSASPKREGRWSSRMFYSVFNRAADLDNPLETEIFRVVSRRAINRVMSATQYVPYRKVAYANCGLPQARVYFDYDGANKKLRDGLEGRFRSDLAVDSLVLFTHVGYRAAFGLSVAMIVFTLVVSAYSLVVYFSGGAITGWTTTILFLSFSFFCLFGVLAIAIKYLQVLVDIVFRRQRYSFDRIERL
ncbi:MAG: glycosyltransferase [Adlercreutzia sp.]|nr:glycosyltransferase [Adlercreutzia sp.]